MLRSHVPHRTYQNKYEVCITAHATAHACMRRPSWFHGWSMELLAGASRLLHLNFCIICSVRFFPVTRERAPRAEPPASLGALYQVPGTLVWLMQEMHRVYEEDKIQSCRFQGVCVYIWNITVFFPRFDVACHARGFFPVCISYLAPGTWYFCYGSIILDYCFTCRRLPL